MRVQSRVLAFKIIFSNLFGCEEFAEIEPDVALDSKDQDFANSLVQNFLEHKTEIQTLVENNTENYTIDRIFKVDLALIYLALTEIKFVGTPPAVVVNEVLEIAKKYSTEQSQKFINGVLAKAIK